jgi:hypothetical protein
MIATGTMSAASHGRAVRQREAPPLISVICRSFH